MDVVERKAGIRGGRAWSRSPCEESPWRESQREEVINCTLQNRRVSPKSEVESADGTVSLLMSHFDFPTH